MHIPLRGQEPGHWGYWRLGGVVEGEVRKVIDLSLGSRDAVVYGGASAGAVAFDRKLKDGKTLVVKYTNPELVAVAQRGTYIEDFEFRISLGGKSLSKTAVTKAEKGKPAFRLNYWGKRSRSSDEIIHFAPQPSTDPFQDVGDGWMRASCRFTIPNGIAMIRSFEIADVRGTWDRIEIRRNGMRLVSDAISESTCDDAPTLAPLADPAGTMDAKLDEIRTDEQGEVQLFAEKLALEAKLALLADAEFLKGERDLALQEVDALSLQAKAAESKYQEALNSPFNYACTIQMPGTGLFLHYEGGDGGKVVLYPVAHVFEFVPSGPNWAIKQRGTGAFMMPYPDNTIRHWIGAMAWVFQPSGDGYTIRDANSSRYMHCEGGTGKLILYSTGQVFTLNKTTPTNSNITDAKTAWDAKQKELDAAKERLDDLNKLLGANAGQRPDMEKRLQEIATALSALQAKLGAASAAYLDGVKSQQQGALSMPDLGKDARGLVTRGALLGFVRPAGRLAMQETCEGNVQLSYIDGAGRMRLTCYDATADSRNAAFEQWVTDAGRACLIQRKLGSAASITTPVVLDDSWSIEAWVATPLPTWEWVTLAGTQDQKNATLAVLRGQGLGLRCEGRFFASGYRLDTAPAGWHHIAAIGKGTGKNATVSFYVDGEKVGSPVRPAFSAVSLDGLNDFVELQPASFALTSGVTVSFWVRTSAPGGQAAVLLDAIDAQSRCVLRISMPDRAGSVAFECGQDAAGVDRVALSTPPAQDPGGWTHWAFTKNASTGLMRIYRNGRMWARETGKKRPFAAVSKVAIGKAAAADQSFFLGDISELCMWNKELSATEVQNAVGCPVRTDDPYLIGCWQFDSSGDTDKAKDDSKLAKHGALQGGPTVLDIAPPAQLVIASLGAATGIDPTPPGPPPPPPREPARALVCDGIDDHVEIPAMNIDYAQGITIEAWVRYDQFKPFSRIIDFGNGAGVDNIVFYNNSTTNTLVLGVFRGNVPQFVNVANALELGKWLHLAGTIDAAGNAKIYKNGVLLASAACQLPSNVNRTQNYLGTTNWPDRAHLAGQMVEVRLWNKVRTQAEIQDSMGRQLAGTEPGLAGYWTFTSTGAMDLSPGKRSGIYTGNPALDTTNLPQLTAPPASVPVQDPSAPYRPLLPLSPSLKLSELRIWGTALSDDEMAVNSKTLLSGNEPGLLAYLPLNEATGSDVRDVTGRGHNGTIGTAIRWACAAPIGYVGGQRDGLVSAEYSSVTVDPATGRKTGIMRRFYGSATNGAVLVLPEQRIEELELAWIGNAQFAPTLLGYIEGAPPIPSENLTENPSYNGATSVELVTSKDVEYRWNRSEDIGAGMSLGAFVGYESEVMVGGGLGVESFSKAADVRAGVNFNLNLNKTWRAETNITNRSSNRMTDRLELRGTPELAPKFPQIGQRFIPKNVGYALVISGTADVFVTRLARSGKMVGYQVSPIEDIPPDVNTITFLLNPAYVMQGSLDGLTGSSATSDRFHKHVPAMRAQYGSLYPASYYRVKEAYALKQEIDADDKRRESFFAQFSTSGMASSMSDQIDSAAPPPDAESVQGGNDEATQAEQKKAAAEQTEAAKKKRAEIDKQVQDPSRRAHAQTCWNAWQTKMERLQVLAGKRNIVNTYVWDADGGLRTEAQSFASTAEHTIGGSFSMDASLGLVAHHSSLTFPPRG